MAVVALKYITEEEYLELEDVAEFKHEYFNGQIFAMAGSRPDHALITANIVGELRELSKRGNCRVYSSDLRIRVPSTGLYTYPDVSMICGELKLTDHNPPAAENPTLLVEVLSDSTKEYDRGEKWSHFQSIESLREYVLIWQDRPRLEQYVRTSKRVWNYVLIEGEVENIEVHTVEGQIALKDIYRNVTFPPTPTLRAIDVRVEDSNANGNP